MKANAPEKMYIPEKIYLPYKDGKVIGLVKETGVPYKSGVDGNIEYTSTDAFIEKVARFLENKLYYRVEIQVWGTVFPSLTSKKAFIDEFVNYMKGE
jgi:hypothetical protein